MVASVGVREALNLDQPGSGNARGRSRPSQFAVDLSMGMKCDDMFRPRSTPEVEHESDEVG